MAYRLQTSGELRLVNQPEGVVAFPEKGLLILAFLFAEGQAECTRARLARLIWGGLDAARALTNLRQTIARIAARQEELGVSFLQFDATYVRFVPGSVTCDLDSIMGLANLQTSDCRSPPGDRQGDDALPPAISG